MKASKKNIIWLDEVWRWPLAGPVAVGGVFCLPWFDDNTYSWATMVNDSKKLSSEKREYLTEQLLSCPDIVSATSFVSAKYIDSYGIVSAIRKASLDVISAIINEVTPLLWLEWEKSLMIFLDGKTDYGLRKNIQLPLNTVIKWDSSVREIAAASIIAKVQRDKYMIDLSNKKKYQFYAFDRHKWYGTFLHRTAIATHWLSDEHRKSFCKNYSNLLPDTTIKW